MGIDLYYFFLPHLLMGSAVAKLWAATCFHMSSVLWLTYQQSAILHTINMWK